MSIIFRLQDRNTFLISSVTTFVNFSYDIIEKFGFKCSHRGEQKTPSFAGGASGNWQNHDLCDSFIIRSTLGSIHDLRKSCISAGSFES